MRSQQFTIPHHFIQFTVGEIKVDREAKLVREYVRLLLDAFVPYQEAMLAYLDELITKHDPQLVKKQLKEVEKQSKKKSTEWEQTLDQLVQTDEPGREKIIGRLQDLQDEKSALRQTDKELMEKLDIATRSQTILHHKQEDITKLLQQRQAMVEEGTWEKIGGKDNMSSVFSFIGDESIGFGFSKITLQASPTNDIYDWMMQYHPESLPPGDPFPVPPALKKAPVPEKKEERSKPQTEFPGVPDTITANLRTFLAIRRPGYTLLSLVDRSDADKRAWLALLTRKLHDERIERVSDVIIELEPQKYMAVQNVQDPPETQQSPDAQAPS